MRRISVFLMIIGIVLIIGGNFFYKTKSDVADSRLVTVTKSGGGLSFKWPVYTGIILLFLGGTFNLASRRNTKADHRNIG